MTVDPSAHETRLEQPDPRDYDKHPEVQVPIIPSTPPPPHMTLIGLKLTLSSPLFWRALNGWSAILLKIMLQTQSLLSPPPELRRPSLRALHEGAVYGWMDSDRGVQPWVRRHPSRFRSPSEVVIGAPLGVQAPSALE